MSINFQPDPNALPQEHLEAMEDVNRSRIAGWWDLLGEEAAYPCDTGKVIRLLDRIDYRCDHDVVVGLLNDEAMPPVPRQAGRLSWSATSIVTLAAALEARRRWKPFSPIHGHKLSAIEKLQQVLDSRGQDTFSDLAQYDIEGLLGMLHQVAHDSGAVVVMTEALRHKLKGLGVI